MKKLIRAVLFAAVLIYAVQYAGDVFYDRNREALSSTYYEVAPHGCDVLFVGNSLIMNAVYPMELYGAYGICGYNLGTGGQSLPESKHLIEEGIRRFSPKLIVLDTTQLIVKEGVQRIAFLHYLTDNMPFLSPERFKLIADLSAQMAYGPDEIMELIAPVTIYHQRWPEITDITRGRDPKAHTAGAKLTGRVLKEIRPLSPHEPDENASFPPLAVETLKEIIALCAAHDTELCLISIPLQSMSQEGFERRVDAAGFAERLAAEAGIRMWNQAARADELGFDRAQDSADGIHLNICGALKFSAALGAYLHETYQLPDRRGDAAFARYEALYSDYLKAKEKITVQSTK